MHSKRTCHDDSGVVHLLPLAPHIQSIASTLRLVTPPLLKLFLSNHARGHTTHTGVFDLSRRSARSAGQLAAHLRALPRYLDPGDLASHLRFSHPTPSSPPPLHHLPVIRLRREIETEHRKRAAQCCVSACPATAALDTTPSDGNRVIAALIRGIFRGA